MSSRISKTCTHKIARHPSYCTKVLYVLITYHVAYQLSHIYKTGYMCIIDDRYLITHMHITNHHMNTLLIYLWYT